MDSRLDHAGLTRRPRFSPAEPDILDRLRDARSDALCGAQRDARVSCTMLMQDELAAFEADPALTPLLVEVLLLTGSFGQITTLLRALHGTQAAFLPATQAPGTVKELLVHADESALTFILDKAALQGPGAPQLAMIWSQQIEQASTQS